MSHKKAQRVSHKKAQKAHKFFCMGQRDSQNRFTFAEFLFVHKAHKFFCMGQRDSQNRFTFAEFLFVHFVPFCG
jgi:hypothetical protein